MPKILHTFCRHYWAVERRTLGEIPPGLLQVAPDGSPSTTLQGPRLYRTRREVREILATTPADVSRLYRPVKVEAVFTWQPEARRR